MHGAQTFANEDKLREDLSNGAIFAKYVYVKFSNEEIETNKVSTKI